MSITMPFMAPKKKPRTTDRHKPGGKMTRVRPVLVNPAQSAADAAALDFTEWVNIAIREKLEREGRWPVKS